MDIHDSTSSPGAMAQRTDQASLSNLCGALSSLQSDSPDRSARLEGLTSAIAVDAYPLDAFGVSDSLINMSLK